MHTDKAFDIVHFPIQANESGRSVLWTGSAVRQAK